MVWESSMEELVFKWRLNVWILVEKRNGAFWNKGNIWVKALKRKKPMESFWKLEERSQGLWKDTEEMRMDKQEGHIGEYLKFSLFFKQRDAIQGFFLGGVRAVTLSTCIWGTAVLVTVWNIYWRSKWWDTQRPIQRLSFNRSIFLEYQLYTWQTVQVNDGENVK